MLVVGGAVNRLQFSTQLYLSKDQRWNFNEYMFAFIEIQHNPYIIVGAPRQGVLVLDRKTSSRRHRVVLLGAWQPGATGKVCSGESGVAASK